MHGEDFNVNNYYSINEIHSCSACVHISHATICYCLHDNVYDLFLNLLGTWQDNIADKYSLLLTILSYLAPEVLSTICYCVKIHSLQSIYYTMKNCWIFHPHYFEGFSQGTSFVVDKWFMWLNVILITVFIYSAIKVLNFLYFLKKQHGIRDQGMKELNCASHYNPK